MALEAGRGWRVAVDASLFLYQCVFATTVEGPASPAVEAGSFLAVLTARLTDLLSAGWQLVFVFDGKPPAAKSSVLLARRQHRQVAHAKLASSAATHMSAKERATWLRRTVTVTRDHVNDTKDVLQCLEIPWLEAAGEADVVCGWLGRMEWVDAVLTDDSDMLALRCPRVIRTQVAAQRQVEVYHVDGICHHLQLTPEQFTLLCVLLGCDYVPRFGHLRPVDMWWWVRNVATAGAPMALEALGRQFEVDVSPWCAAWDMFGVATDRVPAVARCWCPGTSCSDTLTTAGLWRARPPALGASGGLQPTHVRSLVLLLFSRGWSEACLLEWKHLMHHRFGPLWTHLPRQNVF